MTDEMLLARLVETIRDKDASADERIYAANMILEMAGPEAVARVRPCLIH